MILNLQSESANNMLGLLINPEQVMRINFESDKKLSLDDSNMQKDLQSRADKYFTHNDEKIKYFIKQGG